MAVGFSIVAERLTKIGRIEAVLEFSEVFYIFEFKMSSVEVALEQTTDLLSLFEPGLNLR